MPVVLNIPANAIRVVSSLIGNFPPGKYDLGFPRPVGGPSGFDPAHDVFFSVPDKATALACWQGKISRSLDQMLEPARTAIRAAMSGNPRAVFAIIYPDGLNHLHVKAYS
jgi:hypothetical protein